MSVRTSGSASLPAAARIPTGCLWEARFLLGLYWGLGSILVPVMDATAGPKQVTVVVYAAYGSPRVLYVSGRALEKKSQKPPSPNDSAVSNLCRSLRDLESDEIPGLRLQVKACGQSTEVATDSDGLFEASLAAGPGGEFTDSTPPQVEMAVVEGQKKVRPSRTTVSAVILRPGTIVLLSDVDDTVVDSQVTRKAILVYRSFLKNAAELKPIPGVSRLYRGLARSPGVCPAVFYLSGSPAGFFGRLRHYLELHEFPPGPLLLKNLGPGGDSLRDQKNYKGRHLRKLAERLPGVQFLLFGDSGESDPEIYSAFRQEHPEQVAGIFIRRVEAKPKSQPVPDGVLRTEDAFEAARHLVRMGLLGRDEAQAVGQEVSGGTPLPEEWKEALEEAVRNGPDGGSGR
ncbi:MAG: DUF2183 domain-containing protein [Planctomycetes bacterium]|nr:DUF2183 domain-containing protein [Planctomycetota bacterium]